MKKTPICLALLAVLLALPVHAFEIKGFTIGDQMTECPEKWEERAVPAVPGGRTCEWDLKTFGGGAVRSASISFLNGRVVSIFIRLEQSGRYANASVRDAMIEKYGKPHPLSEPHLNEYRWGSPSLGLHFDGWRGFIMTSDGDAVREATRNQASRNKSDM